MLHLYHMRCMALGTRGLCINQEGVVYVIINDVRDNIVRVVGKKLNFWTFARGSGSPAGRRPF